MPSFTYTARTAGNSPATGKLEAASRRAAVQQLQARGLQVVRLDEDGITGPRTADKKSERKIKAFSVKLRLPFLEALADLIQSGMSAGESVRLLALRLQEPQLRALCASLWTQLGEGSTLSAAMAAHPQVFDGQTTNLIAAGEATGNLREVLARLTTHFHEQRELRRQFTAAMAYPAFICLLGFGVVLFLLFFLLPRLQGMFDSLGAELPFATKLLINGSRFFLVYGPILLGVFIIAAISLQRWRQTPTGKRQTDAWILKIPIVNDFTIRAALLNFTHTLGVLLENGINTSEALRLTERAVQHTQIREMLRAAADRVIEGASLSAALLRTKLLPPLLLDRLAVGEQTGQLAPSLRLMAKSYQAELTRRLQLATKLVSGSVLFATFGFVAFLAYAIVIALLRVSSSFRL